MSEYNASAVGGPRGSYASINKYNQGVQGTMPPVSSSTVVGKYIVPCWPYISSHDTLMKPGNCCGYPTIGGAYGMDAETWQPTYTARGCSEPATCGAPSQPQVPQVSTFTSIPQINPTFVPPVVAGLIGSVPSQEMPATYFGGASRRSRS